MLPVDSVLAVRNGSAVQYTHWRACAHFLLAGPSGRFHGKTELFVLSSIMRSLTADYELAGMVMSFCATLFMWTVVM